MKRKRDARWSADCKGFSLHTWVRIGALDRKGRERLVRYCTRPPLAMERLSVLRDGSVACKLKWANKRSSHRVLHASFTTIRDLLPLLEIQDASLQRLAVGNLGSS